MTSLVVNSQNQQEFSHTLIYIKLPKSTFIPTASKEKFSLLILSFEKPLKNINS